MKSEASQETSMNREEWKKAYIDLVRKDRAKGHKDTQIFWNVDTQYDFMRDDSTHHGTLAIPYASTIENNLAAITTLADKLNILVMNTADLHTPESIEISKTPDYKTSFPEHCLRGTTGAEYIPATNPRHAYRIDWKDKEIDEDALITNRNIILYKDHFDIFSGNPHAHKVLDILQPKSAIVYGVATDVCVNYAVIGLKERGISVTVVADAIMELPNANLDPLFELWARAGVTFAKTEDLHTIADQNWNDVVKLHRPPRYPSSSVLSKDTALSSDTQRRLCKITRRTL